MDQLSLDTRARGETTQGGTASRELLLVLAALAVAAAVFLFFLNSPSAQKADRPEPALRIGQQAPTLQVRSLEGQQLSVAQFRGQPLWLTFWATWCEPCRVEMPELAQASREADRTGRRMIAINVGEPPTIVMDYLARSGYRDIPVALDPQAASYASYRPPGFPMHVFIDSQGVVRKINVGPMNAAAMERALEDLR